MSFSPRPRRRPGRHDLTHLVQIKAGLLRQRQFHRTVYARRGEDERPPNPILLVDLVVALTLTLLLLLPLALPRSSRRSSSTPRSELDRLAKDRYRRPDRVVFT
jgi:hypothetical protein